MRTFLLISLCLFSINSYADVFKCKGINGKLKYQNFQCDSSESETKTSITSDIYSYTDFIGRGAYERASLDSKGLEVQNVIKILVTAIDIKATISNSINGKITAKYDNIPVDNILQDVMDKKGLAAIMYKGELLIAKVDEIKKIKYSIDQKNRVSRALTKARK